MRRIKARINHAITHVYLIAQALVHRAKLERRWEALSEAPALTLAQAQELRDLEGRLEVTDANLRALGWKAL